jgi:aspartyl-tRNA(Asn)/glutamyl-tRNA(Gln) amidotransferase subunit A
VPFAVKDLFETAGMATTAGSKQLLDYVPAADAEAVRLLRRSGSILLGKLNTHEFAAGATGDNPHFGAVRNPWDRQRLAGGSSSGSAAAVAAGLVPFALGTDTGGSVRIPAALCGVIGMKPTFGLISCAGVIPEAWSLDHVGILLRSASDLPLLLAAATGRSGKTVSFSEIPGIAGLRIGVPKGWVDQGTADSITSAFTASLGVFERLGASVHAIDFPHPEELTAITRIIMLAESAAFHLPFLKDSPELYGQDVRARFEFGAGLSATEYINANRMRARLCFEMRRVWSEVDLVVSPTTPITAPLVADGPAVAASLARFTSAANLLGWPAITIPGGFDDLGLPIGLQLMTEPFRDDRLVQVAARLEVATGYIRIWPSMT